MNQKIKEGVGVIGKGKTGVGTDISGLDYQALKRSFEAVREATMKTGGLVIVVPDKSVINDMVHNMIAECQVHDIPCCVVEPDDLQRRHNPCAVAIIGNYAIPSAIAQRIAMLDYEHEARQPMEGIVLRNPPRTLHDHGFASPIVKCKPE